MDFFFLGLLVETNEFVSQGRGYCQEDQKDQVNLPTDLDIRGKKKIEHFGIQLESLNNKCQDNQEESKMHHETGSTIQKIKEEERDSDSNTEDFTIIS